MDISFNDFQRLEQMLIIKTFPLSPNYYLEMGFDRGNSIDVRFHVVDFENDRFFNDLYN